MPTLSFSLADVAPDPPVPGGSGAVAVGLILAAIAVAAVIAVRKKRS